MEEEKRIRKRNWLREGENVEVAGQDPGSAVGGQWNKASELSKTARAGDLERKCLHWTELISVWRSNTLHSSWLQNEARLDPLLHWGGLQQYCEIIIWPKIYPVQVT